LQSINWIAAAGLAVSLTVNGAEIPAGYVLEARLIAGIASDKSRPGDQVTAELISPAIVDGRMVAPPGALLHGRVRKADALGFGIKRGRASLGLDFHELSVAGESVPVRAALAKIDTAREELNGAGDVNGISPAVSVSSALAAYAWRLVMLEPAVGAAVWAVKFALAPAPDPEIRLPVGTEVLVQVMDAVTLPELDADPVAAPLAAEEYEEWRRHLESKPPRVDRTSGAPADRINLMLAGDEQSIKRAFEAAGWTRSEKRTPVSLAKTYFHIVQRKGYPTGPMSPMTFEGKHPELTFQKGLNTYARRHHLRMWRTGVSRAGLPLWAVAATEDTNIHFSKQAKSWTHEIDVNIDNERAKVVSDLLYTGCVDAASLIELPLLDTPEFITDGAVAALRLNACEEPRAMAAASLGKRGNAFTRTIKALCKDVVRSNFGQIAVTGAHVPPQAFSAKPAPVNHREAWAQQQATMWTRRSAAE
jgi:hypothetical protein